MRVLAVRGCFGVLVVAAMVLQWLFRRGEEISSEMVSRLREELSFH